MATIIKSKDLQEVADAIEAIALPPGSARVKREAKFSIDLNAYIGGVGGWERLHFNNVRTKTDTANTKNLIGMTAPVGLAFSGSWKSFGLTGFMSLLDVGALASYRLNDTITEALPKVTLENIFAPGGHFIVGIPKSGVSFGFGFQLGPFLRKIAEEDAMLTTTVRPNYRWTFNLTYDIPLLNFKLKPK